MFLFGQVKHLAHVFKLLGIDSTKVFFYVVWILYKVFILPFIGIDVSN